MGISEKPLCRVDSLSCPTKSAFHYPPLRSKASTDSSTLLVGLCYQGIAFYATLPPRPVNAMQKTFSLATLVGPITRLLLKVNWCSPYAESEYSLQSPPPFLLALAHVATQSKSKDSEMSTSPSFMNPRQCFDFHLPYLELTAALGSQRDTLPSSTAYILPLPPATFVRLNIGTVTRRKMPHSSTFINRYRILLCPASYAASRSKTDGVSTFSIGAILLLSPFR
ncbi:hypothetical protein Tco_0579379 [Tanacetum coccineum]